MLKVVLDDHHYAAALYELVHRGTPGDLEFYRRACADADNVLELGCGYGRVLMALAGLGLSVTGLDRDPELLALGEEHAGRLGKSVASRIEFVLGDMTDFDLISGARSRERGTFDRILIPYSGLYCLLTDEACESSFRQIAAHLRPTGKLILDAYTADRFHAETDPAYHVDKHLDPIVAVEYQGEVYDVFERTRWERDRQRLDVTYEYIPRDGGAVLQGSIAHRYLLEGQLERLLERAGLTLISLAGDFNGGDLAADSDVFVATARLGAAPSA
jgi:SAM-dependent methyltransferase